MRGCVKTSNEMRGPAVRNKIGRLVAALGAMVAAWSGVAYAQAPNCTLPRVPANAQIVLAGAYEGQSASTVAVNGLDGQTTLAFVDIEPGTRPIYFVATSYDAMIWVFRGATDRVVQTVLASNGGEQGIGGAGAVGLPAARVRTAHGCVPYFYTMGPERRAPYTPPRAGPGQAAPTEASDPNERNAVETVQRLLGRRADVVTAFYGIYVLSLPSGRITQADGSMPPPEGFHRRTWAQAMVFNPGGLAQVNAADVVGDRAEAYDVLPNQMGLAQLVGSGQMQYMGGFDQRGIGDYRLVAPIARFPAELRGGHSVRILIDPGVPMPAGDPGHSCVVSSEEPRILHEGAICDIAG